MFVAPHWRHPGTLAWLLLPGCDEDGTLHIAVALLLSIDLVRNLAKEWFENALAIALLRRA
jgi:hypothetical protein